MAVFLKRDDERRRQNLPQAHQGPQLKFNNDAISSTLTDGVDYAHRCTDSTVQFFSMPRAATVPQGK
ncbi:hypothetical protein OUZ56_031664 [Daphnia magna]|uniref:Uncharacterized protein n=1 Tax=Daphnia magna TaxID=35525 RepID=A0ABQ9ZUU8_9CRUS|nr:hypothetical protein OUZ56_031664 [Daphnia magna]